MNLHPNMTGLKPAKKGEVRNPNGRPKKLLCGLKNYFFSEHNVKLSDSQCKEILGAILTKSREELVELTKKDNLPFWISMIVKKAHRDYEKGSIDLLEVLFSRLYGLPKQSVEQKINVETFVVKFNE